MLDPTTTRATPKRTLFANDYFHTPRVHFSTPAAPQRAAVPPPQQLLLSQERHSNDTAAAFARTSPKAGFLYKLGSNIPEFERRFFVLKPSTHLYYFLSPTDTEPRGCIELEGSSVELLETLPDGTVRFAIRLEKGNRRVILEARSEDVGQEWMASLKNERLSYYQQELMQSKQKNLGYKQRIADLDKQVRDYKMVEKDRDGALEDAAKWKNRYEHLNEAVRLLTLQLRRPPQEANHEGSSEQSDGEETDNVDGNPLNESISLAIEALDIRDTRFSALNNACQQLRDSVQLAAAEASTAVEDLQAATKIKEASEMRLQKAEKHLCKLWEENTAIRQELKVTKTEKRVLVKEVKTLRAKSADLAFLQDLPVDEIMDSSSIVIDSEGERLIEELEAQVESSIRLHEQLLAANTSIADVIQSAPPKISASLLLNTSDSAETAKVDNSINGAGLDKSEATSDARGSPIRPKILSLMDDDSSDDDDDDDDYYEDNASGITSTLSSVGADLGEGSSLGTTDMKERPIFPDMDSDVDSIATERQHPLLALDEQDDDSMNERGTTALSEASKSMFTDNGQATSRLECPLADVIETGETAEDVAKEDGKVYHLTFYSRKIGIQFQKVPPASFANGVLTEAMTADLAGGNNVANTAAELRRIAAMTRRARGYQDDGENNTACAVATPIDAVLVCGFHGFDDTANHTRPNLGARLVAFDGVSVELGKWTFESIRKAIQARGRPLTLSFRNDFLTTQQRSILTKAVSEVDAAVPPPKRTIQYRISNAPKSLRSTQQAHSRASSVNDSFDDMRSKHDEDSVSTSSNYRYQTFSAASSVTTGTHDIRSFSEAGASSVFSSSLGPLMANLMNKASKTDADGRPHYMNRGGGSLENMASHHDFQSNLL